MESLDWNAPIVETLGDIMDICERVDWSEIDAQEAREWQNATQTQEWE